MSTGTDRSDGKYLQKTRSASQVVVLCRHRFRYRWQEEKVEVVTQCNGVSDITAMKTGE